MHIAIHLSPTALGREGMGECEARSIEWKLIAMVARTEGEIDVCTAIALDLGEL